MNFSLPRETEETIRRLWSESRVKAADAVYDGRAKLGFVGPDDIPKVRTDIDRIVDAAGGLEHCILLLCEWAVLCETAGIERVKVMPNGSSTF